MVIGKICKYTNCNIYWQDYGDNTHLKLLIGNDMVKVIFNFSTSSYGNY